MAIDREKARAAGYTDEEIDAYEASQAQQQPAGDEPPPPPPADADQGQAGGSTFGEVAATVAGGAAPYAIPAAGLGAAALGGSKMYGAWREGTQAAKALADAKIASERGIMERATARATGRVPMGSVPTYNVPTAATPNIPTQPAAAVRPAMPAPTSAPQAAQANMWQKGMEMASRMREIAASKVMEGARAAAPAAQQAAGVARAAAPAALGLGALTYSGGLNQGEDEELRRRRAMAPTIR